MRIGNDVAEQRWLVQRPRLIDRLESAAMRNVVLVAPAGYGKSTLVRQFLQSRGREVVWYHCTQASADVATLAVELANAFNGAAPVPLGAAERHMRDALKPQQESAHIAQI